jgi:hypothetical protein
MKLISQDNNNWWLQIKSDHGQDITPIAKLFLKLNVRYPGQLLRHFGSEDAINSAMVSWADDFKRAGITGEEAKRGLDVAATRHPSFLINSGEFILCARPAIDHRTAHAEAIEQMHKRETGDDVWSHPAVYWAAVKIGAFDLNNLAWEQIKNRWTHALDEMRRRENLEPVPPRLVSLPAPGRLSVPDEVAKKRMHDIMQNLTAKMSMGNGGVDMLKTD